MKRYTVDELKGPGARVYTNPDNPCVTTVLANIYGRAQSQMYHFRQYRDDARKAMETGDHKTAVEYGMRAAQYRMLAYNTTRPIREEFRAIMTRRGEWVTSVRIALTEDARAILDAADDDECVF